MCSDWEKGRVVIPLPLNAERRNVADRGEALGWEHTKWSERGLKGTWDSSWQGQSPLKLHRPFNVKKWDNRGTLEKSNLNESPLWSQGVH